jgi:hypothetical protein
VNLDHDCRLPEAFKKAWRAEFGRQHLASLINCVRTWGWTFAGEEEPSLYPAEEALLELTVWFRKAIQARNAQAYIRNLSRVVKEADEFSPRQRVKGLALLTYYGLVQSGRTNITKKLLWDYFLEFCKRQGVEPPKNRARFLREIGLEGLPQAQSGRPRKTKLGDKKISKMSRNKF